MKSSDNSQNKISFNTFPLKNNKCQTERWRGEEWAAEGEQGVKAAAPGRQPGWGRHPRCWVGAPCSPEGATEKAHRRAEDPREGAPPP